MENPIYVYPGRFCPPTYGHANIVKRAAELFPEVYVICSVNPDKNNDIFRPEESKALWEAYNLPDNVIITTLDEFMSLNRDNSRVIIIRGIRNYADLKDEEKVMALNKAKFGIDKYFYFVSETGLEEISASKAREMAANLELEKLSEYVAPMIVTKLIERIFGFRNVFMVVGRPGSGKSTFLKMLTGNNFIIDTDKLSKALRPFLKEKFPGEDLVKVAIERKEEFMAAIKDPWMSLLKENMRNAPNGANVFIEIPYGLCPDKAMYRYLGGKVIHFYCNPENNHKRLVHRNTPHHAKFMEEIPGKEESDKIARENRLIMTTVDTNSSIADLEKQAKIFSSKGE